MNQNVIKSEKARETLRSERAFLSLITNDGYSANVLGTAAVFAAYDGVDNSQTFFGRMIKTIWSRTKIGKMLEIYQYRSSLSLISKIDLGRIL